MLERLFGSQTRTQLLVIFLNNPNSYFYGRELARKLKIGINSVRRELINLNKLGFLKSKSSSNRQEFIVNKDYILYPELKNIILKVAETDDEITQNIRTLGRVDFALIGGFFVKDEHARTDLLLIGNINLKKLKRFVKNFYRKTGKEINYTVMPKKEFEYRRICRDRFLHNIFSSKKKVIIDNLKKDIK